MHFIGRRLFPEKAHQKVKKGDVRFQLDKRPFEFTLSQMKADYDFAKISYERIQEAIEKNPNTFSRKQRDEAKASFETASSALILAQYNLQQTVAVAVDDGILGPVELRAGDIFKVWEHSQNSLMVVALENLIMLREKRRRPSLRR